MMAEQDRLQLIRAALNAEKPPFNSHAQTTSNRKSSPHSISSDSPDPLQQSAEDSTIINASHLIAPAGGVQKLGAKKDVIRADRLSAPARGTAQNYPKQRAFESVVAGSPELNENERAPKKRRIEDYFQSKLPATQLTTLQKSKRRFQSESLVATQKPAGSRFASSSSLSISASSIPDNKNQELLVDTSSNHRSHENTIGSETNKRGAGSRFRSDDESFAVFLKLWVFPVIKEIGDSFKKHFHVGDDELISVIKGVETEIAKEELKSIAKNKGYVLNEKERIKLRRTIKKYFKRRIPQLSNPDVARKERRSDSHPIGRNRLGSPGQHGHGVTSPYVLGLGLDPASQSRTSAYNVGISKENYDGNLQMLSKEKWEKKRYQDHETTPTDEDPEKELAKWTSIPKKADPQSDHSSISKQFKATSARSVEQTHRRSQPNAPQPAPSSRRSETLHPTTSYTPHSRTSHAPHSRTSHAPHSRTSHAPHSRTSHAPHSTRSRTLRPRTSHTLHPRTSYTSSMANSLPAEPPGASLLPSMSDPYLEYTAATLATSTSDLYRPYSSEKRDTNLPTDVQNGLQHVDFSDDECEALLKAIRGTVVGPDWPVRTVLKSLTENNTYEDNTRLIKRIHADPDSILRNRKRKGIRAFLSDLANGRVSDRPSFTWVEVVERAAPLRKDFRSIDALLRSRELGFDPIPRIHCDMINQLRLRIADDLQPWRSWKGASGDVVACAWAPNSLTFAAGAAAPSNYEDLQYNRTGNLLLGDLISNVLHELPDHRVERPLPNTIPSGPNSQQDMYNNLDPMISMTVSSLQFSRDGSRLFTASHDKTAKIWDVPSTGTATCLRTIRYDAVVTDLAVSQHHDGLFATASKVIQNPIKVYSAESWDSEDSSFTSLEFSSSRAQKNLEWELYPECLRWGKTPTTSNLLLVGFQQWGQVEADGCGREGEVCLWDVQGGKRLDVAPAKTNVFCATWHPLFDLFAVGGAPGHIILAHPQTTKSVVRTWDIRSLKRYTAEYECPALDMQDITFNPLYPNLVTAGCTDSATYVWDFRKPDEIFLKLQHGTPVAALDTTRRQEEVDPGVMMTVWGLQGSRLYTGSSDGIVKCWDAISSPEDAFVGNVADLGAGVQSGAFSPEFDHLLVGDADGAIHVLTCAPVDQWPQHGSDDEYPVQPMKLINAPNARAPANNENDQGREGILASRQLLQSGQLVLNKKYGVGKGPNYAGPYAKYARKEGDDPEVARLLPEFDVLQPFSRSGHKRREHAGRIKGIISARKQLIADARSVNSSSNGNIIDLESGDDELNLIEASHPSRKKALHSDGSASSTSKKIKPKSYPSTSETVQSETDLIAIDSDADIETVEENIEEDVEEDIDELAEEFVEALVEDAIEDV